MRLIQISVTSVWLLSGSGNGFCPGKDQKSMVDDGNTTGRGALDSRNERGRFSGITGRTVIAGTYLLDPVSNAGLGSR